MGIAAARLQRRVLTDEVYEAVKGLIMDHVLAPGARVGIDQLARELGVSQTPIREVLARLEADGLVVKEPLRGYSTTPLLTAAQLDDLYDLRSLLEPWAAARAAEQATTADRAALKAELASCADAPADSSYDAYRTLSDHDARFHALVARIAGNGEVAAALERTHCHLHNFRLGYTGGFGMRALAEHRRIVSAIAKADPEAAEAAMRSHLDRSRARLRASVDE